MILEDLRGKHDGETLYVLGAGKTVEFYDAEFFADKLTVGVNYSWCNWLPSVDYMVTKYHDLVDVWSNDSRVGLLVVSRGHTGQPNSTISDSDQYVVFDHLPNRTIEFTADDFPADGLVVSYSTITSAFHLAAFMGARHIVVVGADCGWLDGVATVGDYPDSLDQSDFAPNFELQNRIVADKLRDIYGCSVSSMLPFVTPNMEGHKFVSPFGSLNA
jgi:hypothetical protein